MRRLLLALVALLFAVAAYAAPAVVDWDQSFVNVRAEPAHGSKKVGAIQQGGKVEILSQKGDWAKVRYAGGEGWVVVKSLRVVSEKAPAPKPAPKPDPAPEKTAPPPAQSAAPAPITPPEPAPAPAPPQPQYKPPTPAAPPASGYLSDVPDRAALPEVSIGKTLVSMVSGLLLVLAIIGAVVWAIRRFLGGKFPQLQGTGAIRVLATRPIAQRQSLLLVEVGGEVYFISQTDSDVRLISKVDSADAIDRLDYLFTFKATKFESELRKELDVETREEESAGGAPSTGSKGIADSIAARLAALRGRPGSSEKP